MKALYLIFLMFPLVIACKKETFPPNVVRIRIIDPTEHKLLDGFTYKIESYGVAYANNTVDREGAIPGGQTTFSYYPGNQKFRTHELTVSSNGIKGHFVDYINSTTIGSKGGDEVFYFIPD